MTKEEGKNLLFTTGWHFVASLRIWSDKCKAVDLIEPSRGLEPSRECICTYLAPSSSSPYRTYDETAII